MLCVLAVFVPSIFMAGVGRQLFVPLSLAFSMIASYVLSSTLVPVFSTWLLKSRAHEEKAGGFSSALARSTPAISVLYCISAGPCCWSISPLRRR
jgi:multidrug efflux pump subunit AcrB